MSTFSERSCCKTDSRKQHHPTCPWRASRDCVQFYAGKREALAAWAESQGISPNVLMVMAKDLAYGVSFTTKEPIRK